MKLDAFIADSLDEILSGIAKAKKKHKGVAPVVAAKPGMDTEYSGVMRTKNGTAVYMVEFDVAVTVGEEKKRGMKGAIAVVGIGSGGGESTSSHENRTVSRLSFRVPISYE